MTLVKGKPISIIQAAEILGKTPEFVKTGLQRGTLPIGTAVRLKSMYAYYISPELLNEYSKQTTGV